MAGGDDAAGGAGSRTVLRGVMMGGARPGSVAHGDVAYVWPLNPQNAGNSSESTRTHGSTMCWAYVDVSGASGGRA